MSGRGLTAESEALVDTSIDGSGRYGGHHWPACNGFVDDEWSKCDCGLVQAAFDIEAAAAREALEALVPWFGQADALYLRRERDAAYVTSTHNGYTDVRSTWLAEVMTLLAALRAARASDGGL